jgi:uncharacterized protein (TIGR00369 family)
MAAPQPLHNEPPKGFDGLYGLQLIRADAEEARARLDVGPQHLQSAGIVHGGVYCTMAETLASMGTWVATGKDKFVAGMSNNTTFLRPVREGTITGVATPRQTGRTTWVWDVELIGDDGRPAAISRVTIAVREPR